MSNLEQLIATWRATLKFTPEVGHKTVEELENHLRETITPLLRSGMNEAEAFQRAVAQLGTGPALASEFKKLHQTTWLPVKVTTGLGIAMAIALLVALLANYGHNPRWSPLLVAHVFTFTLGYLVTLLTGLLGICFVSQRCYSGFPEPRVQRLARSTFIFGAIAASLTAIGLILGMFWAKAHLGHWWQWEPKETTALGVLAWLICFLTIHWIRGVTVGATLVMSVIGNLVVCLAWFGPFLLNGHLFHGAPSYAPMLLVAVIFHLGFVVAGMAPADWPRTNRT